MRKQVRFFTVRYVGAYVEADAAGAAKLLAALRTHMKASARFAFEGWAPSDLKAGDPREKIRQTNEEASQVDLALIRELRPPPRRGVTVRKTSRPGFRHTL